MRIYSEIIFITALLFGGSIAWAEPFGEPTVHKLTVRPAPEPTEALKYELFPQRLERSPGNAAMCYYRAILLHSSLTDDERKVFEDQYENASQGKLDLKIAKEWLSGQHATLLELERATNREYCDWDLRFEEIDGVKSIELLLPELQELRQLAKMLSLKFEVELAEGEIEKAIQTLRISYRLGVDAGNERLLINALVGAAIAGLTTGKVEKLIQHEECPDLYWALAGIPDPVVDLKPALEVEMSICERMFPILRNPEEKELSAEQWSREIRNAWKDVRELAGESGGEKDPWKLNELAGAALMVRGYPKAKKGLLEMGYDARTIEAMPTGKVIAVYQSKIHQHVVQESGKWHRLPYHQVREHMKRTERELISEGYLVGVRREVIPIVSMLLPAVGAAHEAQARTQRGIAVLRLIEAIRMHAHANDGEAPDSLNDLTIVPAPIDPYWGKPFVYRKTKTGFEIEAKADSEQLALSHIYQVTIKK